MQDGDTVFVRKTGDIDRNLERFDSLSKLNLNLPKIHEITGTYYDMEYISCLEMKKYLSLNKANVGIIQPRTFLTAIQWVGLFKLN